MHLFHEWHHTSVTKEIQPTCGPYDPRSDEARTIEFDNFVCCICGRTKKLEYWHRFDYMCP